MSEYKRQSWIDLLETSNSGDALSLAPPEIIVEDVDNEKVPEKKRNSREIEIEFVDSENEKKFDKLVTENKIKSPFKRHRSNELLLPNEGQSFESNRDKKSKLEDGQSPKKRFRSDSSESSGTTESSSHFHREFETDKGILERRQKQIDYGKNTVGYDNYITQVPKLQRSRDHPKTPPKNLKYSRRAWEGLVKAWRKKLHAYDPYTPFESD